MKDFTIDEVERYTKAARLRARGYTFQQIADELGYSDRANAKRAVDRALVVTMQPAADELRALEIEKLNLFEAEAWKVLETKHLTVSHGKIIRTEDDQPLVDDAPVLAALDRLLKIAERRAKLLGLDAPTKHEVWTLDAIDAAIRELDAQHAELAARAEAGEAAGAAGENRT